MPAIIAQFIHDIDPVMIEVAGLRLWYYGTAYAAGFVGVFAWLWSHRRVANLSGEDVLDFSLLFALCVLVCGRAFEVVVYEWPFYARHPGFLLCFWLGGMASHGVLLGGVVAVAWYARISRRPFLQLADQIAVPAALFLALGRIGNFISGDIIGTPTDRWWGVRFPGEELFRHPVTLYESAKNLALIPILLLVKRTARGRAGFVFGHFVFWYGFLRLLADLFREYGRTLWGIGTGQYFNAAMATLGLILIYWRSKSESPADAPAPPERLLLGVLLKNRAIRVATKLIAWLGLLLLAATIRSAWTVGFFEEMGRAS